MDQSQEIKRLQAEIAELQRQRMMHDPEWCDAGTAKLLAENAELKAEITTLHLTTLEYGQRIAMDAVKIAELRAGAAAVLEKTLPQVLDNHIHGEDWWCTCGWKPNEANGEVYDWQFRIHVTNELLAAIPADSRAALADEKRKARQPYLSVVEALQGIIEIGKRDMTNPKYDGYFEYAKEALAQLRAESKEKESK